MLISGKGMNNSLTISTKNSPKSKQKEKFDIADVFLQSFVKILEEFKDLPYQGYMINYVKNKPTDTYYFLVKQLS